MEHEETQKLAEDLFWEHHREGKLNHIRVGFHPGSDIQLLEIWHQAFMSGFEEGVDEERKAEIKRRYLKDANGTTT
jgi:hypothetical protein